MAPRFWWRLTGTRRPCPLPFTEITLRASWGRPRLIQLRLPFGPLHSCAAERLTELGNHYLRVSRVTVGTSALPPEDLSPAYESGALGWADRHRLDLSSLEVGPPSLEDAYLAAIGEPPASEGALRCGSTTSTTPPLFGSTTPGHG